MPWTEKDVDGFKKGLTTAEKKQWVSIANASLTKCLDEGGKEADCSAKAITMANGVLSKAKEGVRTMSGVNLKEAGKTFSAANMESLQKASDAVTSVMDILKGLLSAASETATPPIEKPKTDANTAPVKIGPKTAPVAEADISFNDISNKLQNAIMDKLGGGSEVYVSDVFSSYVIYSVYPVGSPMAVGTEELWRCDYTIDDSGAVTLGEPAKVEKVVQIAPVTGTTEAANRTAGEVELIESAVPLMERSVDVDGLVPLKFIQPGWGSSGYYPADVLERDGPRVFTKGTHMYWDHPSKTEERDRPERSLRDLAATFTEDAHYYEYGVDGPGLYAKAKVFGKYKDAINELGPNIGVSIRGMGNTLVGEAEGRKGPIIQTISDRRSVDFVTQAGAGGKVLELFESLRGAPAFSYQPRIEKPIIKTIEEQRKDIMNEEQLKELETVKTENARLKEAILLSEARTAALASLAKIQLPELTRNRLAESVYLDPPIVDGALDREALEAKVQEAAKAELDYLTKITGAGTVKGLGPKIESHEAVDKSLAESFASMGMSEAQVKLAVQGRG